MSNHTYHLSILVIAFTAACTNGILETGGPFSQDGFRNTDSDSTPQAVATDTMPESDTESDSSRDSDTSEPFDTNCSGGGLYENVCWYIGEVNENCLEVCEGKGGYFEGTTDYFATSNKGEPSNNGESLSHCENIYATIKEFPLDATGVDLTFTLGLGLGCHVIQPPFGPPALNYAYSPEFDKTHKSYLFKRVCGCGKPF